MADSREREQRRNVPLPIMVRGFETTGAPWDEMTTSTDISVGGVGFNLKHPVVVGQVLELAMPLPKTLRRHDVVDATYHTYSIVRSVNSGPPARIGVMFYGKKPPRGFKENPTGRYLFGGETVQSVSGRKVRRFTRHNLIFNTKLLWMNPGAAPREEITIIEDMAEGGARVLTTFSLDPGDEVTLDIESGALATRATVRGAYVGPDGIKRLNLEFLSPEAGPAARQLMRRAGAP
jgi:hypothetical protein